MEAQSRGYFYISNASPLLSSSQVSMIHWQCWQEDQEAIIPTSDSDAAEEFHHPPFHHHASGSARERESSYMTTVLDSLWKLQIPMPCSFAQ